MSAGKLDQFGFEAESLQKKDKTRYCTRDLLSGGHLVLFL